MTPKERRAFEAKYWYYGTEECALNEDEIYRLEGEEFWWDWDDLFLGGIDFWEECEEWIEENNDKFADWDWEAKWFEWEEQRKQKKEQMEALEKLKSKEEEEEEEEVHIICRTCKNGGQYEDGSYDDNHECCDICHAIVCFKKDKYENDEDGNLYCKYCI